MKEISEILIENYKGLVPMCQMIASWLVEIQDAAVWVDKETEIGEIDDDDDNNYDDEDKKNKPIKTEEEKINDKVK